MTSGGGTVGEAKTIGEVILVSRLTVREVQDLLGLLREEPKLREQLRRLILPEEFLRLPAALHELAQAQLETQRALKALAEEVKALAQAQKRTEERLEALAARVDELAQAQKRTEQRVEQLAQAQKKTEERLEALAEAQRRTEETLRALIRDVAELKGMVLESEYRDKAYAYFGRLVRRAHVLSPDEISELLDRAVRGGHLSDEEAERISWADVIVRGNWKEDGREVFLVVEVSWRIERGDVERARERAELLGRAGLRTVPVVAGRMIEDEALTAAREMGVLTVIDGKVYR